MLWLYLVQHMLHQIKAQQFHTDLVLYQQCYVLLKIVEFKDFSRPLSDFPVLFKADLMSKYFSRNPSVFKYFSSLCEPLFSLNSKNQMCCLLKQKLKKKIEKSQNLVKFLLMISKIVYNGSLQKLLIRAQYED